jgi:hypothetical protein
MPWACSELKDVVSPAVPLPLCGGKAKGISVAMSNSNIFQRLFYIVLTHDANELIKLSSAEVMAVGDAFCSRLQSIPVD